jgi:uncharacterized protein
MTQLAILNGPELSHDRRLRFDPSVEDVKSTLNFLSYADGVISAIVAGPEFIPVDEWMPLIVNTDAEDWRDGEASAAKLLMLHAHDSTIASLKTPAGRYEPIFGGDGERPVTCHWAEGFIDAMSLRKHAWENFRNRYTPELLAYLSALMQTEEIDAELSNMGMQPDLLFDQAVLEMPELVSTLYWARRRAPLGRPISLRDGKTGRNDPCPCGSGKKYKKCCLN